MLCSPADLEPSASLIDSRSTLLLASSYEAFSAYLYPISKVPTPLRQHRPPSHPGLYQSYQEEDVDTQGKLLLADNGLQASRAAFTATLEAGPDQAYLPSVSPGDEAITFSVSWL